MAAATPTWVGGLHAWNTGLFKFDPDFGEDHDEALVWKQTNFGSLSKRESLTDEVAMHGSADMSNPDALELMAESPLCSSYVPSTTLSSSAQARQREQALIVEGKHSCGCKQRRGDSPAVLVASGLLEACCL